MQGAIKPRNIFSALSRYAYRQQENFLTESLAYLLEMLQERDGDAFGQLANLLAGQELAIDHAKARVSTQESTEVGRPDLVLAQEPDFLIFIEIKHDSPLGSEQLERYYDELSKRQEKVRQLVLLTRSKHAHLDTNLASENYHRVYWYQISELLKTLDVADETASYLVDAMQEFLRQKGMSMDKVEEAYALGVPALRNLVRMTGVALSEAFPDAQTRNTSGWDWIGYYFGGKSWVGIWYREPLTFVVEKESDERSVPSRSLDLAAAGFFDLAAGDQLELLIEFIQTSVKELGIDPSTPAKAEADSED